MNEREVKAEATKRPDIRYELVQAHNDSPPIDLRACGVVSWVGMQYRHLCVPDVVECSKSVELGHKDGLGTC